MFVIDTNLLLYAVNPDADEHLRARELIEAWRVDERSWFITWGIIYEFLRVATHPRVFSTPLTLAQANAWIAALLAGRTDSILIQTDRHRAVLNDLAEKHSRLRGNPVHDLHIAALMIEHGVPEIRTADTDFHQFAALDVVNPLVEA